MGGGLVVAELKDPVLGGPKTVGAIRFVCVIWRCFGGGRGAFVVVSWPWFIKGVWAIAGV